MGKTATDLTRDSASIILTDDNFNTIIAAVKEGRRTYDNIRKFVMYLLACNSAEIYLMLIAVIVGIPGIPLINCDSNKSAFHSYYDSLGQSDR